MEEELIEYAGFDAMDIFIPLLNDFELWMLLH
jgi:hypothetical protein